MSAILPGLLHLLAETAIPFVLGLLLGSALETFLPRRWTERWLAAGPRSLVVATLAGALLPGCALSTVPVARSLRARGAPAGTVAAFLLIAPLISPHTIALTALLVGGGFAVARVVLPIAFTLLFGTIANACLGDRVASPPPEDGAGPRACTCGDHGEDAGHRGCDHGGGTGEAEAHCGCGSSGGCGKPDGAGPLARLLRAVLGNLRALAPLYVGSIALVAVLTAFIRPAQIATYGAGPLAYVVALCGGIPLYVCDGGEVPLTRSLLALGLGAGPAFTFMLASVGTCLPTITLSLGIIGRRLTFAYVAGVLLLALLGGLLVAVWPLLQPVLPAT